MRRGTTQTLDLSIPYKADEIEAGYVTFQQSGLTIFEKDITDETDEDVELSDELIRIFLSQEESLALPTGPISIQIRLRLTTGDAVASNVMETHVDDVLKDGVI